MLLYLYIKFIIKNILLHINSHISIIIINNIYCITIFFIIYTVQGKNLYEILLANSSHEIFLFSYRIIFYCFSFIELRRQHLWSLFSLKVIS